ncbi:MAG: dihydrofolate reductase [Paludibacteraceae bacterium]|nr:dihydrofolate reductase [Paludibacteraceae bacterium]MBR4839091.1 dihydrofolate reductase [Paludibacteraceae bacterium]
MKKILILSSMTYLLSACGGGGNNTNISAPEEEQFCYSVDKFADIEVLRYKVPGFEELSLNQKKLVYFLSQAALEGRDILFDQNNKYNLTIRKTLEGIYESYPNKDSEEFKAMETYLKRVWFSNGIHHHYATDKFRPEFTEKFFQEAIMQTNDSLLPLQAYGNDKKKLIEAITPVIFDTTLYAKRVNQAEGADLITSSANNYYENVTEKEVDAFYDAMRDTTDATPISYGLNSKLTKENGKLIEKTWKVGGMYTAAIEKILFWLEKAKDVAENDKQKAVIEKLIEFYHTGDLKTFDEYSILWVKDQDSRIDFVNGFIETYGDPLGLKASWESIVNFKNIEATRRTETISQNAQWFEDHSPVAQEFKKPQVKGVSAKVITTAILAGDCYPATPIGINLPNSNWIRQLHGSKSVTIENITDAYDKAARGNGFKEEFAWSQEEIDRMNQYGFITDNIHTDLHECLGHGSGQLLPGVSQDALRAYGATIEEARADLFGLYYEADDKLVELGLLPNKEAYKAEYYSYMMNGLMTQLMRIEPGNDIEEAHMRNRQLIARWILEKGAPEKVVELKKRDGKTFVVINDYEKMRNLVGQLLAEIQRIKSEGDFEGAKNLVETYGVKVDEALHKEVKERYAKLKLAPYKGFVNPVYEPVVNAAGEITDIKVRYDEGYIEQMLRYGKENSHLPVLN